jgi:hypothetical protein
MKLPQRKAVKHMYLTILKKDLKRKKTMNIVLLMFMILAVMFVASGLNNVVAVMNGTDYYLDKAEIGDYVLVTMGDNSTGYAGDILDKADCVKSYKLEGCIFGSQDCITKIDGTNLETKNTALFQSISDVKLGLFDESNQPVTEVKQGEVKIAGKCMENNDLKIGDVIRIKLGDTELFAQKSADGSAAASELTADGDNSVRHSILPFCCKVAACVLFYEYHSILSGKSQAIFVSFDVFYTSFR